MQQCKKGLEAFASIAVAGSLVGGDRGEVEGALVCGLESVLWLVGRDGLNTKG